MTQPLTGDVRLDERIIPAPSTVSEAARAYLALLASFPRQQRPPREDRAAWEAQIAALDAMYAPLAAQIEAQSGAAMETVQIGGVTTYVATRRQPSAIESGKALLYLHGGALIQFGGAVARAFTAQAAAHHGGTVYGVDYRMPPAHPYPAPLDDCVAVYRQLLARHGAADIAVMGLSAGGNLSAALMLRARDEGLALPAALVLFTPELDLTESGDTFQTCRDIDVTLKGSLAGPNELYAAGHDLADPFVSPLFGDFAKGYPPTFLQAGTRDLFLSNAVRMHRALRRAGVATELHVWEGMPHAGFGGATAEDAEVVDEANRFLARHWLRA